MQNALYTSRLIYNRRGSGDTLCTNARKTVQVPPILSGTTPRGTCCDCRQLTRASLLPAWSCCLSGAAPLHTTQNTHHTVCCRGCCQAAAGARHPAPACTGHTGAAPLAPLHTRLPSQDPAAGYTPQAGAPDSVFTDWPQTSLWLAALLQLLSSATQASQEPCRRLPIQCSPLHAYQQAWSALGRPQAPPPAAPALRQATQTVPAGSRPPAGPPLSSRCMRHAVRREHPLHCPTPTPISTWPPAYASHFWAVISARSTTRWL
jgi:hypothetical protein